MSRLETTSEEYRKCSIARNADHYTPNKEYCEGSPDVISDGDMKGRNPQDPTSASSPVGTSFDIKERADQLARNAKLYTCGKEYCEGTA